MKQKSISLRTEILIACSIILLGTFLRFYALGSLPYGLNQDEASAGYDAWALLTSGIDRNGDHWPVLFVSWGSGQNALMTYLSIPFIRIFSLNEMSIRIVNALFGSISLVVFWLLSRKIRGSRFGLTALLLLCLNPWHIMATRWALESNLLPAFLLFGIYFTILARYRQWFLLLAAISFGLSIYAYGTAFFILPIILIGAVVWMRHEIAWKPFLISLFTFLLIALPIALCQLANVLDLGEIQLLGLTLPKLTEARQAETSVFGSGFRSIVDNFKLFGHILFRQSDGLVFNSLGIRHGGMFYFFGIPLILVGLFASLRQCRHHAMEIPMLIWTFAGILCAGLINGNINRLNFLWLSLVYWEAVGAYTIYIYIYTNTKSKCLLPISALLLCACFGLFAKGYVATFGGNGNSSYFPGLVQAIEYCENAEAENIYITNSVNQPYIFALFASQTPPEEFTATVNYENENAAFRTVTSFGKYTFGPAQNAQGDYAIISVQELTQEPEMIFSKYAVIRP